MKKIFLVLFVLLFISSAKVSVASYPVSCPDVAQAIVDAVGGCSAVNCSQYEAICSKCCVETPAPKVVPSVTQPSPKATAGKAKTPVAIEDKKTIENSVTKDVGLASASATMTKLFNTPIFITILLIVAIAFAGMWAYEKFFKKQRVGK